jgi:TPR repeat protein
MTFVLRLVIFCLWIVIGCISLNGDSFADDHYYEKAIRAFKLEKYEETFKLLMLAEKNNDTRAMLEIGNFYKEGFVVKKDCTKAEHYFIKAASLENWEGFFNISLMYKLGLCVDVDFNKAYKFMFEAAKKGFTRGESQLGLFYEQGVGVAVNYDIAINWYEKAAYGGDL